MKLDVKKSLNGGEFKLTIEFKAYEVFEEGLVEDFGAPTLELPVSTWGATVTETNGAYSFSGIAQGATGNCTIDFTAARYIKLNNTFKTEFSVKISDIEQSTLTAPLDSVVKMAEAKCTLFIEIIKQEAKAKMDDLRAMKTDFEAIIKNPEVIRI